MSENITTTKYDLLEVGTRVKCEYRLENEGTVLSVTDPAVWYGRFTTQQEAIAHLEHCAYLNRRLHSQYGIPLTHETKQPVLWDFGKIYWDSAKDLYPA